MGSFYATCSVSNMTLSYQKTSVILLVPSISTDISGNSGLICSNDGAQIYFSPFGFPIHGEYYDYGQISNIVRDDNVLMLEKYFGVDINEITDNIGRSAPKGIKEELRDFYSKLQITFIRTEILEYLETGWDKFNLTDSDKNSGSSNIKRIMDRIRNGPRSFEMSYDSCGYLPMTTKSNMLRILPIDIKFKDYVLKQYRFLMTLGFELDRILLPSNYGGQEINHLQTHKLNEFVNDLIINDMKERIVEDNDWSGEKKYLTDLGMRIRGKKIDWIQFK